MTFRNQEYAIVLYTLLSASMRMLTVSSGPTPGKALLLRVLHRVWESGHHARSQEDLELTAIVLQVIGQRVPHLSAITDSDLGDDPSLSPLDLACTAAYGCLFDVWRKRNTLRLSRMAWELSRCVPDYDPTVGKAVGVGRSAAGGGALYEMPSPAGSREQEPLPKVSGAGKRG